MTRDVQLAEPAAELLRVATEVTPAWMRRSVVDAVGGPDPAAVLVELADLDTLVALESSKLLDDLADLLATDVDQQRTTPLSLYRAAVAGPTALLRRAGVSPRATDAFSGQAFPDDVYGLGPATWADIDPAMHEAGLVWGAWKAMTVLRRRRDDGLRGGN